MTTAALAASDLEGWILGCFSTVAEVREGLAKQPVMLEPLALLGGAVSPFHYVARDRSGASLVIEFDKGLHPSSSMRRRASMSRSRFWYWPGDSDVRRLTAAKSVCVPGGRRLLAAHLRGEPTLPPPRSIR